MIKQLLRRIQELEQQVKQQQPSRSNGILTNRTTRGVTRKPTQKTAASGAGEARWA